MPSRTAMAVILAFAATSLAGPGLAADAADPLTALPAIDAADLAALNGRQGISISNQELIATTQGGQFNAGESIKTGVVNFGSSMQRMNGMTNQAINTGNNSAVNASMPVHIHLY